MPSVPGIRDATGTRGQQLEIIVAAFLPLAVVVIMFSLGLGLTLADFRRILERPRAFLIGALNQIVLLPIMAFIIVLIFGFSAETAVGFMILAACPGGAASNVITKLANWDVALSVTLTASFSLTCALTIPFILSFAVGYFMGEAAPDVNIASTAITAFLLTAVPIALGVTLHTAAPQLTATISPTLAKVALVLFILVLAAAIAANWHVVTDNIARLGLGLLALVTALSLIGYFLSRSLGSSDTEAKTISIETGSQNGALALAIAGLLVVNGPTFNEYAIPAAIYGIVWLLSALPAFLFIALRRA